MSQSCQITLKWPFTANNFSHTVVEWPHLPTALLHLSCLRYLKPKVILILHLLTSHSLGSLDSQKVISCFFFGTLPLTDRFWNYLPRGSSLKASLPHCWLKALPNFYISSYPIPGCHGDIFTKLTYSWGISLATIHFHIEMAPYRIQDGAVPKWNQQKGTFLRPCQGILCAILRTPSLVKYLR